MPLSTAGLSDIANRLTGGSSGSPQHMWFFSENRVAGASMAQSAIGRIRSWWNMDKTNGAIGVAPASTAISSLGTGTVGALPISSASQVTGGFTYLLGWEAGALGASGQGTWMLYDRLAHGGPYANNVATAQGAGATPFVVDRYNSTTSSAANFAGGNQIWLEISTALGSTAQNVTLSYANELGTSGKTTQNAVISGAASSQIRQIIPVPLASGDRGVTKVDSVTCATSQAVAAAFNIVIARPIMMVSVTTAGAGVVRDTLAGLPSLPRIEANACLAFTFMATLAADPAGVHGLHFVDGP